MGVTLLTRRGVWCDIAAGIAETAVDARVYRGDWGERWPDVLSIGRHDVLISFLCPWVVPASTLDNCRLAINFHPGDRNYPGIGCYNFALYEGAERYGAIAHHMLPKVDTGSIFMERTFRVAERETVASLRNRTLAVMLGMLSDALDMLPDLPEGEATWTREPFTRANLNRLCEVSPDMPAPEIQRRVRATSYPGKPGARIVVGGVEFHRA